MLGTTSCYTTPIGSDHSISRIDFDDPEFPRSHRSGSFWSKGRTLEELIRDQGIKPIARLEDMRADFWPENEDIEELVATIRRWRSEG